jgi:Predicted glycosyltransferases
MNQCFDNSNGRREECNSQLARQIGAKTAVIVPTLNPEPFAKAFIAALKSQSITPMQVLVIDSDSDDGSLPLFEEAGFDLVRISRADFDHGGTRNRALCLAAGADFVVFLTQDAILMGENSLLELLVPFSDPTIALVYGRQLPRATASLIECHAREFNYPSRSKKKTLESESNAGIKAVFNSNSFAAYRMNALMQAGGFPSPIIFAEDQIVAGKLLLSGWAVYYASRATAVHSHSYSLREEFKRYFDHGVAHGQNRVILSKFGNASSEGLRFIRSECMFLLERSPYKMPEAWLRTGMKLVAYRLGKIQRYLPSSLSKLLSMNRAYFVARHEIPEWQSDDRKVDNVSDRQDSTWSNTCRPSVGRPHDGRS